MLKRLTVYLHNIVNLSELHQLSLFFRRLDLSFHLPSRYTIIMYMSKLHTMCVLTLWLTDQQLVPIALLQAGQLALLHTALVQYLVEVWEARVRLSPRHRWGGRAGYLHLRRVNAALLRWHLKVEESVILLLVQMVRFAPIDLHWVVAANQVPPGVTNLLLYSWENSTISDHLLSYS